MSRFGPFELLRRISFGGTAEVFVARNEARHGSRLLALKRLLPSFEDDPSFVQMFVAEANLARRFRHPRVARVLDVGAVGDSHYIAMELVQGHDLARFRRRLVALERTMPWAAVVAVGAQAADALHYVHGFVDEDGTPLQVVHRDVSPQNLIVEGTGGLKLTDFGIAKFEGSETTQAGVLKGKHAYMSPEQVRRAPLDSRSDLFALGIVLYELLTGRRLFKGASLLETLERVERAEVPPLPAGVAPTRVRDAVMACLERLPEDRPTDAGALADLLRPSAPRRPEESLRGLARELFGEEPAGAGAAWDATALLHAAELDGVETTDQKQVTDATRVLGAG